MTTDYEKLVREARSTMGLDVPMDGCIYVRRNWVLRMADALELAATENAKMRNYLLSLTRPSGRPMFWIHPESGEIEQYPV